MSGREVIDYIKAARKPIADHHLIIGLAKNDSNRYYASVYKRVIVKSKKYGDEFADTSVANIMTRNLDEYKEFVKLYTTKRDV